MPVFNFRNLIKVGIAMAFGVFVSIFWSSDAEAGSLTNVVINGTVQVGQVLTSTITKSGTETGPNYQWVYADTITAGTTIIANGSTQNSIVVPAIGGKYIQLQYFTTLDGVYTNKVSSWALVVKAPSSIAFTPPPLTYGTSATLQATGLVETSTGSIQFVRVSDSYVLCTATKTSSTTTASCSYAPNSVNSLQIRADYLGDSSYNSSTVTSSAVTPSRATPSLSLSYLQSPYVLGGTVAPSISYSGDGSISYSTSTSSSICSVDSSSGVVTMNGPGNCSVAVSASSGTNFLSANTSATFRAVITPSNIFTIAKGPTKYGLIFNIEPQVGVSSYTIRMYTSANNYGSVDATYSNYVSGNEISENVLNCNSTPRICWAAINGQTMKFTISANSASGYTVDSTPSALSDAVGIVRATNVTQYYPDSGVEGLKIAWSTSVSGRTTSTIYFYPSANSYLSYSESRTISSNLEQVALPTGEYFRTSVINHGGFSGGVTWFDSPMSDVSGAGSERYVYAKPANPSNVHISSIDGRNITVSWDRATGALQNYTVALSRDGSTFNTYGVVNADIASYTFTNVSTGILYYAIVANKTTGTGSRYGDLIASPESATVYNYPSAPGSGALVPGDASINVRWGIPSDNGGAAISHYLVMRSIDGSTWTDTVTVMASETSTVLTGLTNATPYYVRVAALNIAGLGTWLTFGSTATPMGTARAVVQPVVNITSTSATLSATVTSGGYLTTPSLEWGEYNGTLATVTFAARDSATSTVTYEASGLTPGMRYQVGSITTPGTYSDPGGHPYYFTTTPNSPTNIETTVGNTSITVSWDAMPGASGYYISFAASAQFSGVGAGTGCTNVTIYSAGRSSCTITGLTSGRNYDIEITATIYGGDFGNGTSAPAQVSATTTGGISTVSISIAGDIKTAQKGKSVILTALINVAGKVKFLANGKVIPGCSSKKGTTTVSCAWKPVAQGKVFTLTAVLKPNSISYSNSISNALNIGVSRRTGYR